MEFEWSSEDLAFRKELKAFLDEELPGYQEFFDLPAKERHEFSKAFAKKLAERHWLTPAWPRKYGGQEQSAFQQLILSEEMIAHGEPRTGMYMNVNWVGPAIILAGSEEQKNYHLQRMSRGDVMWCQGFSEPDSGSDLASLRTRAIRDGDEYVVNGEKIWTSNAGVAEFIFLLARTNVDVAKQNGIAIFLVPIDAPGIEVRPVHGVIDDGEFYHLTFTDVRIPASCRLGEENEGFRIVRSALALERSGIARYHRAAGYLDRVAGWAKERGLLQESRVVDALASARASCEAARVLIYRVLDERKHGKQPLLTAFTYRVATVRAEREVMNAAFEIMGADGLAWRSFADCQFEWAVTAGIAGGSYEMNLNSIGRQIGLHKAG
jgi:alkylation response protein AidB-like acyl-CoA dehydrogenase